ncbi:early activation antigen CD69-like [Paramisgurnus dabryanus]|uniref:early activation antigen CD69-like n=1 Tax=Paramisgurnus dabryanus TaxID=90735 RepID=UPI003CCF6632
MKIVVFSLLLTAYCELTTALKRKHFYFNIDTTWREAQSHCRSSYVDLSSLDSQDEITAINNASGLIGSYPDSWIGLKKISTHNWQWSDGSHRSFVNWENGQPDESGNDICTVVQDGELFDRHCTDSYSYFCYK